MYVGPVQRRFLAALDYTGPPLSPDELLRNEPEKAKEYPGLER